MVVPRLLSMGILRLLPYEPQSGFEGGVCWK